MCGHVCACTHGHVHKCTHTREKNKDIAMTKNFNDFSIQLNGKPSVWL